MFGLNILYPITSCSFYPKIQVYIPEYNYILNIPLLFSLSIPYPYNVLFCIPITPNRTSIMDITWPGSAIIH